MTKNQIAMIEEIVKETRSNIIDKRYGFTREKALEKLKAMFRQLEVDNDKERRKMQNELADIIQFYDGFLADFIRYGWQPRGE